MSVEWRRLWWQPGLSLIIMLDIIITEVIMVEQLDIGDRDTEADITDTDRDISTVRGEREGDTRRNITKLVDDESNYAWHCYD